MIPESKEQKPSLDQQVRILFGLNDDQHYGIWHGKYRVDFITNAPAQDLRAIYVYKENIKPSTRKGAPHPQSPNPSNSKNLNPLPPAQ